MNNNTWTAIGKVFFALAILSIGIVHLVTHNFPIGLLPVPNDVHLRPALVYISGIGLILSGLLILSNKFMKAGAWLAFAIWLIFLLVLHLPILIHTYKKADEWTPLFEDAMLLCGAMILIDVSRAAKKSSLKFTIIACYLFAAAMIVFAVLHFIYADYIATLITPWIPFKLFWAYFVGAAFLAVAVSIITRQLVSISAIALGIMFLLWFFILHLPRVVSNIHTEPEWTSMFVVLASSGVAFLMAGSTAAKPSKRR